MKHLISVIVPIYNVENYLEKCIHSILQQSYSNLEIILVNDGSTDGGLQICRAYEEQDSRIVVIDKTNGGLSDARNAGLDIAKGEYIIFVDSDDWIHKEMINTLYQAALDRNADMAICNFLRTETETVLETEEAAVQTQDFTVQEALENMYNDLNVVFTVAWNKIYKRELFYAIRFPKGYIHEDMSVMPELIYNCNKISYIPQVFYYYRITPDSIMNKKNKTIRLDVIEIVEHRLQFFLKMKNEKIYYLELHNYMWLMFCLYCRMDKADIQFKKVKKLFKKNMRGVLAKHLFHLKSNYILRGIMFCCSPKLYAYLVNRK